MERETAVKKYFMPTPEKPSEPKVTPASCTTTTIWILTVLFGLGILGAIVLGDWGAIPQLLFLYGIPVGGYGLFYLYESREARAQYRQALKRYEEEYSRAEPKPSDEQMDKWLWESITRVKRRALKKLDLLPEQILGNPGDPIILVGPSKGAQAAVGKDGNLRFSHYEIVIIYLTNYHLAVYKATLDMATGEVLSESTQEYHYEDVVSVSTETVNDQVFKVVLGNADEPLVVLQKFTLSVANGEHIEIVIAFPRLKRGGGDMLTDAEKAIRTIRAMLREKKGGSVV